MQTKEGKISGKQSSIEKVIFKSRDGKLREATSDEIARNRIPPDVSEVIILKKNGTWSSFFPDPLGR